MWPGRHSESDHVLVTSFNEYSPSANTLFHAPIVCSRSTSRIAVHLCDLEEKVASRTYLHRLAKGIVEGHPTVTKTDMVPDDRDQCGWDMVRHYKISLHEPAASRSLTKFNCSKELVKAIADALEAHDAAYFSANILHGDISARNILISRAGSGLLVDWDLCIDRSSKGPGAIRADRTGTWRFMSSALLLEPTRMQDISDDRESAFHVLAWVALRYSKHSQLSRLPFLLDAYDQVHFDMEHHAKGGQAKCYLLLAGLGNVSFTDPHLNKLIEELRLVFCARYSTFTAQQVETYKIHAKFIMEEHEKHLANMERHKWMADTLRRYLEKDGWPTDDKARLNPTSSEPTKRKRMKHRRGKEINSTVSSKSQRLESGSGTSDEESVDEGSRSRWSESRRGSASSSDEDEQEQDV